MVLRGTGKRCFYLRSFALHNVSIKTKTLHLKCIRDYITMIFSPSKKVILQWVQLSEIDVRSCEKLG